MVWTLRESGQGVKSAVLTLPEIRQQRALWQSVALSRALAQPRLRTPERCRGNVGVGASSSGPPMWKEG